MDILILGGTRFLGRAVADAALARGDRVTLFHRGTTGAELFPQLEHIRGDRERDLSKLDGRRWDAVFDTCGFFPRIVELSARALAGRIGHYSFISSISVYAEPNIPNADESAPLATLPDPATETLTGETYGALKALCERAAEAALPGRCLSARAGLLVGPNDYTDRFPYWVARLERGGEVLAPDAWDQPLQFIDVRDAATWLLKAAERSLSGPFHLTGPATPFTFGGFLERANAALGGRARFVRVDESYLTGSGVQPWSEMPLWVPGGASFMDVNLGRSVANGLTWRPLEETLRDTLAWLQALPGPLPVASSVLASPPPKSLTAERERALLEEWKKRTVRA
jgi:2'-hydroxyisoflavone reductase